MNSVSPGWLFDPGTLLKYSVFAKNLRSIFECSEKYMKIWINDHHMNSFSENTHFLSLVISTVHINPILWSERQWTYWCLMYNHTPYIQSQTIFFATSHRIQTSTILLVCTFFIFPHHHAKHLLPFLQKDTGAHMVNNPLLVRPIRWPFNPL